MKTILSIILTLVTSSVFSQTIIFNQGFENPRTSPIENWQFIGGYQTTDVYKEGTRSLRIGRFGFSNEVVFSPVDVSQYQDLILEISHSVDSIGESGLDDYEGIAFQVSLDGGNWVTISKVSGSNNYSYSFNDTLVGVNSSGCRLFRTPNPLNYSIPQGTNTISVRVISVKSNNCRGFNYNANNGIATSYDRSDEGFYIDNIRIIDLNQTTFPVELGKFDSELGNNNIKLDWVTYSELNTDMFVIERSGDAVIFETIGDIVANNVDNSKTLYEYIDYKPLIGNNYYRLKIIDLDGSFEYSSIIYNKFEKNYNINVYPNPISVGEKLNINVDVENLYITDLTGGVISRNEHIPLDISPGTYLLSMVIDGKMITNKINVK